MSPRWLARVALALLAAWMLGASALRAQTCSPSDTLRIVRQGAALWYLLVDGDTLRHQPGGPPRGFTSEGIAAAHGVALRALTRRTVELHQTYRGRFLGCIHSSPGDDRDTTVVPPAIDSLPPEGPEQPPQDTVAPDPGTPSARGVITCQPAALCSGDARASVADSVVWMGETGTGTAARLGDFQGLQWGPRSVGFTGGTTRTRTWWLVAWSGARADTARVVWTVPVSEATAYPAFPLGTVIGAGLATARWITTDPRTGAPLTYQAPIVSGQTVNPAERCHGLWILAGLTGWAPPDSLGWARDTLGLGAALAGCRGVIP